MVKHFLGQVWRRVSRRKTDSRQPKQSVTQRGNNRPEKIPIVNLAEKEVYMLYHLRYMVDPSLGKKYHRRVRVLESFYEDVPFRNTPSVNSTTSNNTPPPGASLSTLGTKPLYSAAGPSSRKMVISLRERKVMEHEIFRVRKHTQGMSNCISR